MDFCLHFKVGWNLSIVILGDESQCGSYLLRIRLTRDVKLVFGGFKKGKLISMPMGDYIYVGSANSKRGASSLGRRVVRHATRSGRKWSHPIREVMVRRFKESEVGEGDLLPQREKRLRWNVDHLLDLSSADLAAVYILRSEQPQEKALVEFIEADPGSVIVEQGLGANDNPGHTHLLRIHSEECWWRGLRDRLGEQFNLKIRVR